MMNTSNALPSRILPTSFRRSNRVSRIVRAGVSVSPKPVITPSIPDILKNITPKLIIGGEYVDAASGKTFPLIDPRTEEVVLQVAEADAADVDRAVKVARNAFENGQWPRMSGRERGRVLYKFAQLLEDNLEEFARLETLDTGKPLAVSRSVDIPYATDHFRYIASLADKNHGKTIPVDGNFFAYTLHEPMGVIGQIVPWNFPICMTAWKVAAALAAGNTIVLKPAEQTPLTALRMSDLLLEAGVPEGVVNVLPGYGPTAGAALTQHMDVDKIAFTGSTAVGRTIMQAASSNIKKISLELGGKSPIIVFPDVDIDATVEKAHIGLFFNHGQCCDAGSRVFVHADIYDEFVQKSVELAKKRIVGDPFNEVDQGPQIDEDQFTSVLGYIDSGKEQGAEMLCGGNRVGDKGYYIEPTVFANVKNEMKIAQEEIFGPVQSIFRFSDAAEAVKLANDTQYGLCAGVFTNNLDLANQVSRSLRAGLVYVNMYHFNDHAIPFGGYKMSGIGREKSSNALKHYSEVKTVMMPLTESPWL